MCKTREFPFPEISFPFPGIGHSPGISTFCPKIFHSHSRPIPGEYCSFPGNSPFPNYSPEMIFTSGIPHSQ